jgi:hypothetical protein
VFRVPQVGLRKYVSVDSSRFYGTEDTGQLHVVATTTKFEIYAAQDLSDEDIAACLAIELAHVLGIKLNLGIFSLIMSSRQPERYLGQLERAKARPVPQESPVGLNSSNQGRLQETCVDDFRSATDDKERSSETGNQTPSGVSLSLANAESSFCGEYEPVDLARQSQQESQDITALVQTRSRRRSARRNVPLSDGKATWCSPHQVLGKRSRRSSSNDEKETKSSGDVGEYFVSVPSQ